MRGSRLKTGPGKCQHTGEESVAVGREQQNAAASGRGSRLETGPGECQHTGEESVAEGRDQRAGKETVTGGPEQRNEAAWGPHQGVS